MVLLPKLDHFLGLIADGAWHNLKDIAENADIPEHRVNTLSKILSQTSIVDYEASRGQVRISQEWRKMLESIREEEEEEKAAVGTIVLPPKKSMILQNIQLTNLTEKELELDVKVTQTLKELAIGTIG